MSSARGQSVWGKWEGFRDSGSLWQRHIGQSPLLALRSWEFQHHNSYLPNCLFPCRQNITVLERERYWIREGKREKRPQMRWPWREWSRRFSTRQLSILCGFSTAICTWQIALYFWALTSLQLSCSYSLFLSLFLVHIWKSWKWERQ